ncbi:metalloprotease TldD [candidate division LCP-89 bacterium B3_LCP]|uniref:Metalloprotease TldD n=1 Tax=candidate division LCP-89 bacterium B3_LCP TaxID=2012998 RepID=A0A532V0W7_UNCL8|nr:MAG: metalloprotease TldD [candidate division LCP-89 bacterium B3_LCP]
MQSKDALAKAVASSEAQLDKKTISKLLEIALSQGGEFSEVYIQYTINSSLQLEEERIRQANYGIVQGVGIRVLNGAQTGYGYSDDFSFDSLESAAKVAAFIANQPDSAKHPAKIVPRNYANVNPIGIYPDQVAVKQKTDLLYRANDVARSNDKRIIQVDASFADSVSMFTIANSEGLYTTDERVLFRMNVSVIAEENDRRERGYHGGGGRLGFNHFETLTPEILANEAVRQATVLLDAVDAPAGPNEVVLGNGWAGILLHEAIGHGLEADFNRKKTSLYTGRIGEKVASELCTVIDEGNIPNRRGSLTVDDEGTPTRKNVLIEDGILRSYMVDRLNGKLMNMELTGSGRRQSFKHYPMPRMTNTYMMPGESTPEEIISSVEKGFYAKSFGGGQVDISNGNFVFNVTEGYLIENGKVTAPVKGATLIGIGPEVLTKVVMVGNDFSLDQGIGNCGKNGQSVPVGVGQPHVKISEITVGGTAVAGASMTG